MSGDEINQVSYALGSVREAVERLNENVKSSMEKQDKINDKMDRRVSRVEAKQYWFSGVTAAIGSIFGLYIGKH